MCQRSLKKKANASHLSDKFFVFFSSLSFLKHLFDFATMILFVEADFCFLNFNQFQNMFAIFLCSHTLCL